MLTELNLDHLRAEDLDVYRTETRLKTRIFSKFMEVQTNLCTLLFAFASLIELITIRQTTKCFEMVHVICFCRSKRNAQFWSLTPPRSCRPTSII